MQTRLNAKTDELEYACSHRTYEGSTRDTWRDQVVWHTATEASKCINFPEAAKVTLPQNELVEPNSESEPIIKGTADFFTVDSHGNKHFEPVIFANYLIAQYHFKVMEDNFDIFVYSPDKGIWEDKGSQVIHKEMGKLLDDDNRKRYVEDVKHAITCAKDMMVSRPLPPLNKVAVLNGILNLETGTLEQPSPEQFIVVQIPVKFDPAARCPNVDNFLSQVVPENVIPLLIESVGYCLWQAMPLHKALMLIGAGSNGKSTFQKVIIKLLGEENTTSATLQSLCESRFMSAELYLKLANLSADLPDKALTRTGTFKTTSGGDRVQGEKKFKAPFWFYNYAKQVYSCNQIPSTPDDTDAYYRRWNIIEFPNKFEGKNCNANIVDELISPQELSGLLNRALEVLPGLLKRGAFSGDETTEQIREKYILKSNSAKAFIEAKLEPSLSHTDQILKQELYRQYVYFCGEHNVPSMSMGELTKNMKQYQPGAQLKNVRVEQEMLEAWRYIKWKM